MTATIEQVQTPQTQITKSRTPVLTVSIDPGTSCIKAIYCKGRRGQPKYLITDSLVVPTSGVQANQSYIKLPDDAEYYLVGLSAAKSKDSISIKQLKSEYFVYRILAVAGEIAQKLSLPSQFKIKLKTFLPISEIQDLKFLEPELILALQNFEYSGKTYQVECALCDFVAEGEGIYRYQYEQDPASLLNSQTSVYIMLGYRNTSVLLFDGNQFDYVNSRSTDLGFYNYLDTVSNNGSGLYREELKKAIVTSQIKPVNRLSQAASGGFKSEIVTEYLIKGTSKKQKNRERQSIEHAIAQANKQHHPILLRWLKDNLPPLHQLDRVVYCGGSAPFYQAVLEEFFKDWHGTLLDTNQMGKTMMEKLEIPQANQKKFIEQSLPLRLADAWGEFVSLARVQV